jgi:hypothetical protein
LFLLTEASVSLVTLAPTCPIWVQLFPLLFERSIKKPLSLPELSCHVRVTVVAEPATATRPEGAAGGTGDAGVVAAATLLFAEAPPASVASARY